MGQFVSKNLGINEKGNLTVGGLDTVALAAEFGTPLYVLDEDLIRENCRVYTKAAAEYYGGAARILYASKAFSAKEIYRVVASEGMGVDVVSGGELFTALQADFPAERVYFHGNNKTEDELRFALESGVGRFVVDNLFELETLERLAGEAGKTAKISFRVKPGVEAHTHDFVMTGQIDSKFGVALENGEAFGAVKRALDMAHIEVVGVHCHIGSQIFDLAPFEKTAEVMMDFLAQIRDELGAALSELNLGGGYGIRYTPADDPLAYDQFMKAVSEVVKRKAKEKNLPLPFILMEPGRSIVAPAGITLYEVGGVKEIPGVRKYVSVDGGMTDNPRYALYESKYDFVLANKASLPKDDVVTVAGRCCESGDLLGKDAALQRAEPGDILATLATGAYNYSMASHYNRVPKPAVVMVKDGKARVIVKRETYADLTRNDV
jgi:diaminopimelate decarboxylase